MIAAKGKLTDDGDWQSLVPEWEKPFGHKVMEVEWFEGVEVPQPQRDTSTFFHLQQHSEETRPLKQEEQLRESRRFAQTVVRDLMETKFCTGILFAQLDELKLFK